MKTIVITWNDTRPGHYGTLLAALWASEGSDTDLNEALAYAAAQRRGHTKSDVRVHTFATDNPSWKHDAFDAHNNGGGFR
jgi:hypothetical protein